MSLALAGGFFTTEPPGRTEQDWGQIVFTENQSISVFNYLYVFVEGAYSKLSLCPQNFKTVGKFLQPF